MPVGSKLTLGLLRDGKQVNVNLELQQSSQNQVDSSTIFNGIEGAEMSNKGKDQGVVVNNVKTGTPAAQFGLKKGDVIIGANQQAVKNIAELRKVLDSKPSVLALNISARRQHHLPVNAVISLNPFLKTGRGSPYNL